MISIEIISSVSIILPFIGGSLVFKSLTRELKYLYCLCVVGLLIEGFSYIVSPSLPPDLRLLHYYFYVGFEFILLMRIFSLWSNQNIFSKIGILFLVIYLCYYALIGIAKIDPISKIVFSLLISIISIFLFRKSLLSEDRAMSVVLAGLAMYFFVTIVVYLTFNYFDFAMQRNLWIIHSIMNILMNISFFVGFYIRNTFVKRSINSGNISSGYRSHSTTFN